MSHGRVYDMYINSVYRELDHNIVVRPRFIRMSDSLELMSILFSGFATILMFVSTNYDYGEILLTAGIVNVLSGTCMIYSRYAYKEAVEREKRINSIITSLGYKKISVLSDNSSNTSIV